jgi:pimeloyl-ACP methyl ester carboxylesterase
MADSSHPPQSNTRVMRILRGQLGSIRRVYLRSNRIVRRDDFHRQEEAVLLLHGFMQTRNVWEIMERRLRDDGYGVFSFDLGGLLWRFNTRSIGDLAEMISEKLERICERTGLERFHIVGHSKGGLIARHYVQHHGGDRRVKGLITLGSPHHGTPTAAVGLAVTRAGILGPSSWEILPRNRLLRRMSTDTFPAGIPMVSVYSRHDLVCPWWCSVLRPRPGESSLSNMELQGLGHTELCHDAQVYSIVRRELRATAALWKERLGHLDP